MTKSQPKAIPASEAKLKFGEMLNKCAYGKEPIVIKRHDKPIAVLINFEEWKKSTEKQNTEKQESEKSPLYYELIQLHRDMAAYRKKHGIKITKTTEQLLKESREERTKKLMRPL